MWKHVSSDNKHSHHIDHHDKVGHPIPAPVKDSRNAAADPAANHMVVSPTVISSMIRRTTTRISQMIRTVSGVKVPTYHTSFVTKALSLTGRAGDESFSKLPLFSDSFR